jgi:dihydrofolate reductase
VRKVILFNLITLDGFFAGLNGDISWHQVDEEFNEFSIHQLQTCEGLIFGRITYQLMADYWTTKQAREDDPIVAELMNSLPKYVFSKTLKAVEWSNTQLMRGEAVNEMEALKKQPGKDLFIFGSANLSKTFIQNKLIDEFRIMINPIILGRGIPLFTNRGEYLKMNLINSKTFRNGNILLDYLSIENKILD